MSQSKSSSSPSAPSTAQWAEKPLGGPKPAPRFADSHDFGANRPAVAGSAVTDGDVEPILSDMDWTVGTNSADGIGTARNGVRSTVDDGSGMADSGAPRPSSAAHAADLLHQGEHGPAAQYPRPRHGCGPTPLSCDQDLCYARRLYAPCGVQSVVQQLNRRPRRCANTPGSGTRSVNSAC